MISWMQKHKKWLVITIWISTIAFVGAGFVGWGSYSYGQNNEQIATVGTIDIQKKDLQKEYSGLYAQYQQMFGQEFTQETADKLKLEEQAYNNLVQKSLILNLAKGYGIDATNEEVLNEIVKFQAFFKDGKFDKDTYVKILSQNQTNPTDFEDSLKKDIIFYKTISIFNSFTSEKEMKTLSEIFFAQDNVSINIINANSIPKNYSNEDLKKYWESNKDKYKTNMKYKIAIKKIKATKDEKESKNIALKTYIALKNNKEQFDNEQFIDDKNLEFQANLSTILNMKNGEIAKPIKINDEFIIIKMISKISPNTLTFEQANETIKKDFEKSIVKQRLEEKRDLLLKNFTGINIGYINKEVPPAIQYLTAEETKQLVNDIFSSKTIINSSDFEDKIIVFKIEDTKIAPFDNQKNQFLSQSINKIKNDEIIMSILDRLKNQYKIKSNMKVE